jgi:type I restriction enzyme S subunit
MEMKQGHKQTEVGVIPDDWDVEPIEELFSVSGGLAASRDELSDDGFCYLHYGDIHKSVKTYVDVETEFSLIPKLDISIESIPPKSLLDDGDVVFVDASEDDEGASKHLLIRNPHHIKFISGLHTIVLKSKDRYLETEYKRFCFQTRDVKRQFLFFAVGTKVTGISKTNILKVLIPVPPRKEQSAIAAALSDAYALIASLEKLIAKIRDIKQGTMQQLLTGKKRLPGFTEKWETKKLCDVVEKFVNGGTPSTAIERYWHGDIPWVTGADILDQKVSVIRRFITSEAVENSSTNVVKKGNLLLVSRTGVGKLALAPFDIAISQDFTGIYVRHGPVTTAYLYRYLDFNKSVMQSQNQGTSIRGITRDTLSGIEIILPPTTDEQSAIAKVLSDMDAEIESLEAKLAKARLIKQGMMQELLTGNRRLV